MGLECIAPSGTIHLHLVESSALQFHVMTFVALNSGKRKYILTFRLVLILPAIVCHCITESYLGLSLVISLLVIIMELHLMMK